MHIFKIFYMVNFKYWNFLRKTLNVAKYFIIPWLYYYNGIRQWYVLKDFICVIGESV